MHELLTLVIYLLVGGVILYLLQLVLQLWPIPQPIKTVIIVLVALVVILWILSTLGIFSF